MEELRIPPAPMWYRSSSLVCAPDNTLVYGSKTDIVEIRYTGAEISPDINIITGAHTKNLVSVNLNKKWNQPNKHLVSLGEDNVIKVWDLKTRVAMCISKDHTEHNKDVAVGAIFAGDDRIVSVSTSGIIIIWNINSNDVKTHKKFFGSKVTITCLSSCPHATYLVAFGLFNGSVVVADLRRDGRILYKLNGHQKSVISLTWCPAPVNIFPQNNWNSVGNKLREGEKSEKIEVGVKKNVNVWNNLVHVDDVQKQVVEIDVVGKSPSDFLKECANLKNKILGLESEKSEEKDTDKESQKGVEESKRENKKTFGSPDSGVELTKNQSEFEEYVTRPLPTLFDPSVDILDDLPHFEDSSISIDTKSKQTEAPKSAEARETTDLSESSQKLVTRSELSVVEQPRSEYLLASCGKDATICIWRGGTDGRLQTSLQLPRQLSIKKGRQQKDSGNTENWIACCWVAPNKLLASAPTGELLEWILPKPMKHNSKQYRLVHNEHSLIFNIVAPPIYSTEFDWLEHAYASVWTSDRKGTIINFDMIKKSISYSCYCVTATVSSFSSSPLDPNRLALAMRDGKINVWDLSLPHITNVVFARYFKNIPYKITCIAWHPMKEMILAFGNEDGRVGFVDMNANKVVILPHYFNTCIHKIEWGPLEGNKDNLALYAIADGKVIYFDTKDTKDAATLLDVPEKYYYYKFSWKPDFSLLLLNSKDGALLVLSADLKIITTLYIYEKGLMSIVWHPESVNSDKNTSPHCNWFAATTAKGFLVYDCEVTFDEASAIENPMEKIVVALEGHLKPPQCLAWSLFDANKLVTAAQDGLAHVWDVSAKAIISTFVDPFHSYNPQVIWSPLDPDLIIWGDLNVEVWRVSAHPPKVDEKFLTERKKLIKTIASVMGGDKSEKEAPKLKKIPKNCIVPPLYASNDENFSIQVANMQKLLDERDEKVSESGPTKGDDAIGIFGPRTQVLQLLNDTYNINKKQAKPKYCNLISLWKGDFADEVKQAIEENCVTPMILAMAPMVSPKLWQEACEVYAKKLLDDSESDSLETAMYFLACHKVEEAIRSLCVNQMFHEALALAKCRLPANSEIITEVLEKWALHCANNGNFEIAAHCYIVLDKYEEAAKVLARRNNIEFLEFAAELATKSKNEELAESLKYKSALKHKPEEVPTRADAVLATLTKDCLDNKEQVSITVEAVLESGESSAAKPESLNEETDDRTSSVLQQVLGLPGAKKDGQTIAKETFGNEEEVD